MRTARIIPTCILAVNVLVPAAFAQQDTAGTITRIDRINGTIAIEQPQTGTVGSSSGGAQEYSVKDSQLLENFHAGDKVTFSATESGAARTITKMKKQ
jgi:Cu/Ag efflux protein CusF